jgi:hypothetical protein
MQIQNFLKLVGIAFSLLVLVGGFAQAGEVENSDPIPSEEVDGPPPVDSAPPEAERDAETPGDASPEG